MMHKEFADALHSAEEVGVEVLLLPCLVTPDELVIDDRKAGTKSGAEIV